MANKKIAYRTEILVEVSNISRSISVEIDEHVFEKMKNRKPELMRDYCSLQAKNFFDLQRIFGLPSDGIKKITLCGELPKGAQEVFTLNRDVLNKLRSKKTAEEWVYVPGWKCAEIEITQVCVCYPTGGEL